MILVASIAAVGAVIFALRTHHDQRVLWEDWEELRRERQGQSRDQLVALLGEPDHECVFEVRVGERSIGVRASVAARVEDKLRGVGREIPSAGGLGTVREMMWFDGSVYTWLFLFDPGHGEGVVDGVRFGEDIVIG